MRSALRLGSFEHTKSKGNGGEMTKGLHFYSRARSLVSNDLQTLPDS